MMNKEKRDCDLAIENQERGCQWLTGDLFKAVGGEALNFSFMCAVSFVGSGQNWDILKAKGEERSIKKKSKAWGNDYDPLSWANI